MINFVFGGIIFFTKQITNPPGLWVRNDVMYLDISPVFLAGSTIISYFVFRFINKFAARELPKKTFCNVLINLFGQTKKIRAKIDTGNTLKEPFSLLPVLVVDYDSIKNILPEKVKDYVLGKKCYSNPEPDINFRLIPFRSISGSGLLPAIKPQNLTLDDKNIVKDAYIAICKHGMLPIEYEALVNPDLLD
jgi:stage II sporulation protein GA (sporulation sigma-E factor processing peptidase)